MGHWGVIASAFWRKPLFCTNSSIYCTDLDSSDLTLLPVCVQVGERLWFEFADLCIPVLNRLDEIGSTAIWSGDLRVLSSLLQVFSELMSCVSVDEKTEGSSWGVKCSCWMTLIPLGSLPAVGLPSKMQPLSTQVLASRSMHVSYPLPKWTEGNQITAKARDSFELVFVLHSSCWKRWCFRRQRCILFFIYLPSEDLVAPTDDISESSYW